MSVQRRGATAVLFAAVALAFSSAADAGWGWYANSAGGYGSGGSVGYAGGSGGWGSGGWGSGGSGGWGHRRSWGGSWGGYGSGGYTRVAYGSIGYGSGGWGSGGWGSGGYAHVAYGSGGWGSQGRGRIFHRHHARRSYGSAGWGSYGGGRFASYGSVGYSSVGGYSYGSAGGVSYSVSYGCVGASYGSVGSSVSYVGDACNSSVSVESESYSVPVDATIVHDSSSGCCGETVSGTYMDGAVMDGTVVEGVPQEGSTAPPTEMKSEEDGGGEEKADPAPAPAEDEEASLGNDSALISVAVPADAEVFVNGYKTQSTGSERRFVSSGLQVGRSYAFKVRAVVLRDGQTIEDVKVVQVSAGTQNHLAFNLATPVAVESMLTLHVPENAEVTLAGSPTHIRGTTRVFRTKRLAEKEIWENYTVQVSWEDNGQKHSREKSITLIGGESQELSFGDDESVVAMSK